MSEQKSLQLYIRSGAVQGSIEQTLKDRADDFTTSLLTVINGNPVLQECEPQEVVRTALKAASMRLPIDPNLGLAYIIPYKNTVNTKTMEPNQAGQLVPKWTKIEKYEPQLQIGWKGFVQLALRTRQYKYINVTDVREGEYVGRDRLKGTLKFDWIDNDDERNKKKVTHYVAFFELHDGYEKALLMSTGELEIHAKKYSKSYTYGKGKWADDKPAMSMKTVIKLLLSKWGPQSTELQRAFRADQAAMGDDDAYNYVDNQRGDDDQDHPADEPQAHPADDVPEGEIVTDASDDENTEQADAAADTEAEGPEAEAPAAPPEPPKDTRSVKERAAEWAANGQAANAKRKAGEADDGEQAG